MEARSEWTDQRLDDFAESLKTLPVEVARIREAVDRLTEATRAMRSDLFSSQRQIAHIGWALAAALLTSLVALIIALV